MDEEMFLSSIFAHAITNVRSLSLYSATEITLVSLPCE